MVTPQVQTFWLDRTLGQHHPCCAHPVHTTTVRTNYYRLCRPLQVTTGTTGQYREYRHYRVLQGLTGCTGHYRLVQIVQTTTGHYRSVQIVQTTTGHCKPHRSVQVATKGCQHPGALTWALGNTQWALPDWSARVLGTKPTQIRGAGLALPTVWIRVLAWALGANTLWLLQASVGGPQSTSAKRTAPHYPAH